MTKAVGFEVEAVHREMTATMMVMMEVVGMMLMMALKVQKGVGVVVMEAAAEDGTILNHFPQSLLLALLDPRHHLGLAAAVAVVGVDHLLLDHRRKIGTTLMATTEAMAIVIGKMKIQDGQAAACAVMAPIVTGEMRIQIAIHIPRDVVVVEREEEDWH